MPEEARNESPPGVSSAGLEATVAAMRGVLAKRFGIEDADLSFDRPLDSLGLDSLAFIEYCFEIEGELGITLPDVPRDLATVGDLAHFIHAEASRKGAASAT